MTTTSTEPDVELAPATFNDSYDRIIADSASPNVWDHSTFVHTVPAKYVANDLAGGSAADGVSDGQAPRDRSFMPKGFNRMELSRAPSPTDDRHSLNDIKAVTNRASPHAETPAKVSSRIH